MSAPDHTDRALSSAPASVEAALREVRQLAKNGQWHVARVMAERSVRHSDTEVSGRLCAGWLSHRRGWYEDAWDHFAAVREPWLLRQFVPIAAFESSVQVGADRSERVRLVEPVDELRPMAAARLAQRQLVLGDLDSAMKLALHAQSADGSPAAPVAHWVLDACSRTSARRTSNIARDRTVALPFPEPALAQTNGPTSLDLETLGLLVHLADASRLRSMPRVEIYSLELSRLSSVEDGPWTVVSGGGLRRPFGLVDPLPLNPALRALFVGFHCETPAILTPAACDYLRKAGPVGCRNWATVDLLVGAGIPAFFSDSLAWSAGRLGERDLLSGPLASINDSLSASTGSAWLQGQIREFLRLMEDVMKPGDPCTTGDLALAIAATARGAAIDFAPGSVGQSEMDRPPLTDGPRGAGPEAPVLYSPLVDTLRAVIDGAVDDRVRDTWRGAVARDVEVARQRCRAPYRLRSLRDDFRPMMDTVRRGLRAYGPMPRGDSIEVAMALDHNLVAQLPISLHSLVQASSAPITLTLLTRQITNDTLQRLAAKLPRTRIRAIPCDDVDYGDITRMIPHVTVSTMDRLLLPDLLPEVDRIVYLDVDALVVGDIRELSDWDLAGAPLAARTSDSTATAAILRIAQGLPARTASELRRFCCRMPVATTTFNAGVLVLDLARLRADNFVTTTLPLVAEFGLHDQDALLLYCGPRRAELSPSWNSWPLTEPVTDPRVVHYLGPLKPWNGVPIPGDAWWRSAEQTYRRATQPTR